VSGRLSTYAVYRESELPWLRDLPKYWSASRIKSLFRERDERSGNTPRTLLSLSRTHGLKPQSAISARIASVEDLSSYRVCRPGYLVMNRMQAWSGMFAIADREGVVSPDYAVFTQVRELAGAYFLHLFKTPLMVTEFARRSKGIGSGFNRLYTEDFGAIGVPVPPLDEQRAIVLFVDYVDRRVKRLIRAKRRLIALLNEQKQAIIHRAVTRGLDPDVPLKPSGVDWLGDVPEHWDRRAVGQLFYIGRGQVTSHEFIAAHPGRYPVYSSQTENDGVMGHIDSFTFEGSCLTWTTDGAHAGTVFLRRGRFNCTNVCGTLKPRVELDMVFLLYALSVETKRHVRLDINPKLMNNMMARIRVNLPPMEEQQRIAEFLAPQLMGIEQAIDRARSEIDLVREYGTRLFADVVTGKLDVREAAANLPEEPEQPDVGHLAETGLDTEEAIEELQELLASGDDL